MFQDPGWCLHGTCRGLRAGLRLCLALAYVALLDTDPALGNHVSCGDTIVVDTVLDSDLDSCPNNGIVIGDERVTLDLNGHRIDGDGISFSACPDGELCDTGIVNDGHDDVTILNGAVRQFDIGVFIERADDNRVRKVSSKLNTFFGFVVAQSGHSTIRRSEGSGNPAPEGDGLGLFDSHDIRVLESSFRNNGLGIHVADSPDNLIKQNRISRNADFGVLLEADRNRVRGNRCARNTACLIVAPGSRNVIARNRVRRGFGGIGVEKGRGNVLAHNVVRDTRDVGIYLGLMQPPLGGADNLVRQNRVEGSGGDGFVVNPKDHHSHLRGNVARNSDDDGFDVGSPSTKLTRNRAFRSGDLGIEAASGVIDGGGNRAARNGDWRQCTHIACW